MLFSNVCSNLCTLRFWPALYWKFNHNHSHSHLLNHLQLPQHQQQHSSCPTCSCNCPPPPSLLQIAPGLVNLTVPDCGSSDPDLKKEMAKQFVDLLTEELKLQEGVAAEHAQHMNVTISEARRAASQYQREADKCVAATETCEGARERSEALLRKEMKLTSLWERRAHKLGWEGE
ncbi:Epithelial splicing regulatory protein 1 [Bienertia sinuspersici]